KIIMAISIVLWFLVSYGPTSERETVEQVYTEQLAQPNLSETEKAVIEQEKASALLNASYAAKAGQFIEPVIRPLGYDWKIGISLITSFAAREVFVGTMSVIYNQEDPEGIEGEKEQEIGRKSLINRMRQEKNPDGSPVYGLATILSLIVFYAISMQCMSTLAVTQKEAGWKWAMVMLVYLTVLAYVASFLTYQVFS
ncbi:MAG: nucleoside recognition domain-containing protein, partial [Bacteroidota bacterium]